MPLDFPTSPAVNEIYTFGGRSWQWNGTAWDVYNASSGLTQYVSQLNGLCGSINIAAGTSISITPTGNTLTIAYTGGGGGGGATGNTGATGATGPQGNTGATGATGATPSSYVSSFNGLTGAVTGVTTGTANTFTALQTFNAGLSGALTGNATSASTVSVTDTNSSTTWYPVFAGGTGLTGAYIDKTTSPLTYVPSTGTMTATTFAATNSTVSSTLSVATIQEYTGGGNVNVTSQARFSAGISAAGGTFSGTQTFLNGATFQGNIVAPNIVTSFNGLTGAVTGVTTGTANTFVALQSFASGISASGGGTFTGGNYNFIGLIANTVGGDEGGQIDFGLPATNTGLCGGVVFDIYQNKVRIFEQTGTNRGVYIDLSGVSAGVGTNLVGGGGGGGGAVSSVSGSGGGISVSPTIGAVVVQNTGVHSFNGLTGTVTGVSSVRGLTGAVGITNGSGIGLSVSGQTMTFSNTGVLNVNGLTGGITLAAGNGITFSTASNTITLSTTTYSTTQTLDFSESINWLKFRISGLGYNIGTALNAIYYENPGKNIIAFYASTPTTPAFATLSNVVFWEKKTINGAWVVDVTLKPPFKSNKSAETIISEGLQEVSIDWGIGALLNDAWDWDGSPPTPELLEKEETFVTKTLTGLTWVGANTFITCKILGLTSANHTPEDGIVEDMRFEINNIVPTVGFDIMGYAPEGTYGKYTVRCLGE